MVVSCPRRLGAGLLPRRSGFKPKQVHLTLWQKLGHWEKYFGYPVSNIPRTFDIHSLIYNRSYTTCNISN